MPPRVEPVVIIAPIVAVVVADSVVVVVGSVVVVVGAEVVVVGAEVVVTGGGPTVVVGLVGGTVGSGSGTEVVGGTGTGAGVHDGPHWPSAAINGTATQADRRPRLPPRSLPLLGRLQHSPARHACR